MTTNPTRLVRPNQNLGQNPSLEANQSQERTVQGKGRFAKHTFGYGDPQKTVAPVLGSSFDEVEWNRAQNDK